MAIYLEKFRFPSIADEECFLSNDERLKATCYSSVYPFTIFSHRELSELQFEPITFLYGGNGSGKTTILNAIAEKLKIQRGTYFNKSNFFDDYIERCEQKTVNSSFSILRNSRIITSDDVFDFAFWYFTENIKENALYLLDEPENSLAVDLQLKLMKFIEDSARFFNCQFIIATHSPFLLSIRESKIYDLDSTPVAVRKWTELENVKNYFKFFKQHEEEF